ncbi:MAG: helix-turn-helix domain-containing protein, partial [Peptococcaceae bacterium]|nr:helix-turn-helix domain-containing protein [Peptococcaceae bacterium]
SFFALLQHKDLAQIDLRDIVLLKQSNSQLSFDGIETVETYLECANYKTAAKRLYIHENTLRYRVQKISDLLNLNLENPVAGHSVLIGIKIWKLRSHSDTASDPMGDNAV